MSPPTAAVVFTATTSTTRARSVGASLIEEGLAARVTIMNGARTLSAMEGGVTEDNEVFLVITCRGERLEALLGRLHVLDPDASARLVAADAIAFGSALL